MSRVLYIQYTNPAGYPPLQHSSRILADAGWQVLFLGTGAAGAGTLAFPPHPNITVRRMDFCQAGWRQKLHYLRFCLWAFWTALLWRPRWIYASDPLSCPAALLLAVIPGFEVLYHEHDSPAGKPAGGFAWFIARTRRSLARRAEICVLPNEARLERFCAELGPVRSAVCVWNCPAISEVAASPRQPAGKPVWLLYHGSIVPDRLPPAVVHALALLPDYVHLRVAGYETVGSRGYVAQLQEQARGLQVGHRVEFLGPVSRARLLPQTVQSDIGLAVVPMSPSDWNFDTMTGASNKVFDYMACGLAVIVSDRPDWRRMFADPGSDKNYGCACDPRDAHSIAAAICELIEDPARMRQAGERGRQKILAGWNYEAEFQPVFQRMSGQPDSAPSAVRPPVESAPQPLQK